MNHTAAFVMPVKISGDGPDLRHLSLSIDSIKRQTDPDWLLIMVDDRSDDEKVYEALDAIKADLKEKVHIIHLPEHAGAGGARNAGIRYASQVGAPFILFNDSDDVSHPRRLELVREKFRDEDVNVVYMSFDVIDETDRVVGEDEICLSVREIISGHHHDILEGENAFIGIATRKNYTNLTSCTAVRTALAVAEPFPGESVSEDAHTWYRYGAYPGKFVFIDSIKNHYRICSATESRSRSQHHDFYQKKAAVDSDGFEQALAISRSFGRITPEDEISVRVGFFVREALSMVYGDADECARELLERATRLSPDETTRRIDELWCDPAFKERLRALI